MVTELCVECEDTLADVQCTVCDDKYCALCFEAQHRSGSRKHHKATSLSPNNVPDTMIQPINETIVQAVNNDKSDTIQDQNIDDETSINDSVNSSAKVENKTEEINDGLSEDMELVDDESDEENDEKILKTIRNSNPTTPLMRFAEYVPMRLTEDERTLFNLLDSSLNVSEYTDKVDVLSYRSPAKRILHELKEVFSTLSGLMIATDFRKGKRLVQENHFQDNADFFQQVFEIGRRYKIMNPERMRNNYGKMIYLLQDASLRDIQQSVGFSCVTGLHTVAKFLETRGALNLLADSRCSIATSVYSGISASSKMDMEDVATFTKKKEDAIISLIADYESDDLKADDIRLALVSLADNNAYLASNREPITRMLEYLDNFFDPEHIEDANFSLQISSGRFGARLSHSHRTQYNYVKQSLILWRNFTSNMMKLWWAVEQDLLGGGIYRLRDTGQGLNRVQHAPKTSSLVHSLLHQTMNAHDRWIGSSVVHLGDHNVPNALMFIDKYTQISRILNPIIITLDEIPSLAKDPKTQSYIKKTFGGHENLQRVILCDFFKHGFDGSGADNFYDAGSCIDGRLTSAWNWCSKIEKKPYFHVFLMAGFVGFDGNFER